MITKEQNKQVIDYLISKKLPIDIVSELHDHMLSQIHEYQQNEMTFDEALEKVKDTWEEDLKVRNDIYFGWNVSRLEKRIYWQNLKLPFLKSILLGVIITFCVCAGLIYYNDTLAFWIGIICFHLILYIGVFYLWYKNKKYYKYISKYSKYKLSVYAGFSQNAITAGILSVVAFNNLYLSFFDDGVLTNSWGLFEIGAIIYYFSVNVFLVLFFVLHPKFMKDMREKVEKYLQYL